MNAKMKVLSLAMIGLFGFAGSALAACPAVPGAWASAGQLSGGVVAFVPGGLDGSACKMTATLAASSVSIATVTDNSPANEARYRFQFLVDTAALGTIGNLDGVQIFSANALAAFPAVGGRKPMVTLGLAPGGSGAAKLIVIASCNNAATNYRCTTLTPVLTSGVNRVEVDLQVGAAGAGQLRYWLNAAAGTTEPAPTGTIPNLDNAGWVGAKQANLGLSVPTPSYKSSHAGQAVGFDTFDSRRQTYIGF